MSQLDDLQKWIEANPDKKGTPLYNDFLQEIEYATQLINDDIVSANEARDIAIREEAADISPVLDTLRGMGEVGLSAVTGAATEVAGGIAGTAQALNPMAEKGAGARTVEAVRDLSYQPGERGQNVIEQFVDAAGNVIPDPVKQAAGYVGDKYGQLKDYAFERGGPLAATAVETMPTAILEAIPGAIAMKKAKNLRQLRDQNAPNPEMEVAPEGKSYQEIADNIKSGRQNSIIQDIRPDEQILLDAEELGVDLNPSHYSTNRAYIDVEQGLKSRPGSELASIEEKAIQTLGERADELIQDLGGQTDRSLLDATIKEDIDTNIRDLNAKSDSLYETIEKAIPKTTRTNPDATATFIEEQLESLGGDKGLLTSAERALLALVDTNPTYAALDRVRKDIGSAIGRKSGPFKDDDVGQLRRLYAALSEDQQNIANAFNVGPEYEAARKLVQTRKQVEDQAVSLFGRNVNGSIVPKMRRAAASLTKGDVAELNKLLEAVPESRRQEVVATMLNDIFTHGARRNTSIGQGFVNAFEGINRNSEARRLIFDNLPEDALDRFNRIGRVATGLYNAKALENTSRTARDIIAAMDDGGLLGRMYGVGSKIALAEGVSTTVGVPGAGTAGVIGSILSKGKTRSTQAADALLSSQEFRRAVEAAANDEMTRAQRIIGASDKFKSWLSAQPPDIRSEVTAMGLIPWLIQGQQEKQ